MRKRSFALAAIAAGVLAAPAGAVEVKVEEPTPTGTFSDAQGNKGYVEADTDEQAIRVCNESPATPAGDALSGYVYGNAGGEQTDGAPTYGNQNIGAEDADGEGADDGNAANGTEEHDCP
jgi:hypothetical protein